jgi:hypothetical protein
MEEFMASLFIALTMPAQYGYSALPIFVNAALIHSVSPRRVRKMDESGKVRTDLVGPDAFEIVGCFITTGSGEEQTFAVTEEYGEVTGAIRDALR